jgi:phage shock protein A
MALMTRMTRLFRADAHAVLDRLEEPATLLRQALREMEAALEEDDRRRRRLDRQHTQLVARRAELARTVDSANRELDLCFEAGNEALARGLLRRRLEAERLQAALERRLEGAATALAEIDARLDEHRARLEALRQKAELLAAEEAPDEDDTAWLERDFGRGLRVGDDEVEVALLQERQRRARS